jgi:hypothetical protein
VIFLRECHDLLSEITFLSSTANPRTIEVPHYLFSQQLTYISILPESDLSDFLANSFDNV